MGLPVTFRVLSGAARIEGNTLIADGEGVVMIGAVQADDEVYQPARKQLVLEAQIVTGVGDEPIEMVSVYPVPTDRYLHVKDAALKPVKATLLDVQGRILQSVTFAGDVQVVRRRVKK